MMSKLLKGFMVSLVFLVLVSSVALADEWISPEEFATYLASEFGVKPEVELQLDTPCKILSYDDRWAVQFPHRYTTYFIEAREVNGEYLIPSNQFMRFTVENYPELVIRSFENPECVEFIDLDYVYANPDIYGIKVLRCSYGHENLTITYTTDGEEEYAYVLDDLHWEYESADLPWEILISQEALVNMILFAQK